MALAMLMPLVSTGPLIAWITGFFQRRTLWIAVVLQVLLAGSGYLALESGEAEEERVEHVIHHDALEHHEEAAETYAWLMLLPLPFLGFAVFARREDHAKRSAGAGVLATAVVAILGFRTGSAGGELVYVHNAPSTEHNPPAALRG